MVEDAMEIAENIHVLYAPYYDIGLTLGLLRDDVVFLIEGGVTSTPEEAVYPYVEEAGLGGIDRVLILHGHQDHIGGCNALKNRYGAEISASKVAAPFIEDLDLGFIRFFKKYIHYLSPNQLQEVKEGYYSERGEPCSVDSYISGGDTLSLGWGEIEFIDASGHMDELLCLYIRSDKILFSSDGVQGSGVKTHFPTLPLYSDLELYLSTLNKLANLEIDTLITAHPYKPFDKTVLDRGEAKELLSQSRESARSLHGMVRGIVEGSHKTLDLGEIARRVCSSFGGEIPPQALITVEAHIQKLSRDGKVVITWEEGRMKVTPG